MPLSLTSGPPAWGNAWLTLDHGWLKAGGLKCRYWGWGDLTAEVPRKMSVNLTSEASAERVMQSNTP